MLKSNLLRSSFPLEGLPGKMTRLVLFDESRITPSYISWLNDKETMKFSNQRFLTHDMNTCKGYLASFNNSENLFLAVLNGQGEFIGTMTTYLNIHHSTADIGILIGDRRTWGKGLGLDSWITLMDWLIDSCQIRKITAGTMETNTGMKTIFQKSGMEFDGVRRKQELMDGNAVDLIYYRKFNLADTQRGKQ